MKDTSHRIFHVLVIGLGLALTPVAGAGEGDHVSYSTDVRPILSENCFKCHGPDENARKAGLRLDVPEGAHEALDSGSVPVVPGERKQSALFQRITAEDPNRRMPPEESDKSLTADQIATLGTWIDQGGTYERHWAFVTPERPAVPQVNDGEWPRTPIDRFILARLEEEGIEPSSPADRPTLIRRVSLDLTGLPPSPEEVEAFVNDDRPDAYERLVDSLLDSPHFGERWARHWLDGARYADSNGYSIDSPREIWAYRDYVINAFNDNKPFDQFVIEQMAGDLLPDATREQKVATGFHRNTMINEEGGVDKEEFRIEAVADRVKTVGGVFLGLTLDCARCHDHKYDPIKQKEYYQLFAFLNNDSETKLRGPKPKHVDKLDNLRTQLDDVRSQMHAIENAVTPEQQSFWEGMIGLEQLRQLEPDTQQALLTPPDKRNDAQNEAARQAYLEFDENYAELQRNAGRIENKIDAIPTTMVLAARDEPRETHFLVQGDYTRPGDTVQPGVPDALHDLPEAAGNTRLDLAEWLVDPGNPLLARVTVNRFWQRFFGKGLVQTQNDFGAQGTLPSHPELLDWLAVDFVENDWDIKAFLKQVVMSAVYRQQSEARPELDDRDPSNRLLARQNRLRLEAEIIRDSALTVSGLLDRSIGGPSIYPPQPDSVTTLGQVQRDWPTSTGGDRYRRGLYIAFWRGTPFYGLTVFDAPNAQSTCTRRIRSNTPLQALTLLNDQAYHEMARALGRRLMTLEAPTPRETIRRAYRLCLLREPTERETAVLLRFYDDQRDSFAETGGAEALTGEQGATPEAAAWTMVARALLNLDEFVTRE